MTTRRWSIRTALVAVIFLTGCQGFGATGGYNTGAKVTGKKVNKAPFSQTFNIHVRYGDGSRKWVGVGLGKYRSCQVGELWPSCEAAP